MARPLTKMAGGTTNRRLMLLALVAGIVAAILVYTALSRNSESTGGSGASATASMAPVVVAKQDIPARTKITTGMVEVRQMPLDDRGELAYTDLGQVVGRVTRYPIATSEQVLSTKVVALDSAAVTGDSLSYVIPDARRAMAVQVDEVVAVGGLVLPGDYVDVMGTFDVTFRAGEDEKTEDKYFTRLILQNIEVLAVAQTVVDAPTEAGTATGSDDAATATAPETTEGQRARNTEAEPEPKAATVTLSLTPQEAQLIFLAEQNGVIRMAVRPYGDADVQEIPFVAEPELIPPDLPSPVIR